MGSQSSGGRTVCLSVCRPKSLCSGVGHMVRRLWWEATFAKDGEESEHTALAAYPNTTLSIPRREASSSSVSLIIGHR
jgi:hypothetical protein